MTSDLMEFIKLVIVYRIIVILFDEKTDKNKKMKN
jgi:CRISPR/Cas system-associated endonuclease Cas1